MIKVLVAIFILARNAIADQLVCNTKNETCILKSREFDEFPIVNFTFVVENPENVSRIRFENSEINEIPKLLIDKFENLQILDVKFCELKRFRKPVLEKAEHLIELDLGYNKLKRLEDNSFHGAGKLLTLNLFRNEIIEAHLKAFNGLGQLEKLVLASNELRRLKTGLFKPLVKLMELDLKKNRIESLGKVLTNLTHLEILDLSYNKLKTLDRESFVNLTQLEVIDICYNRIETIHPLVFETNTNLKAINLEQNKLLVVNLVFFSDNLFILDLSKNFLTNVTLNGTSELSISLKSNRIENLNLFINVNRLTLKDNHLEDLEPLEALKSVLMLDISHNPFKFDENAPKPIFPSNLRKLVASNVSLEHSHTIIVFLAELNSTTLNELDISFNDMSEINWSTLATFKNVKSLNLGNCNITNVDGISFAFPKLQKIVVVDNGSTCKDLQDQFDDENSLTCISSLDKN